VLAGDPFTGAGPGQTRLRWEGPDGTAHFYAYADNEYAQVAAELGLPGLALLAFLLAALARLLWRSRPAPGTGGSWAGVVAAAVAFSSGRLFLDVQVEEPVRLVARGAAVDVPLEITCNASGTVDVFVTVTQRVNRGIAAGSEFASFGCTGSGQDATVRVTASQSGRAFVRDKNAVVEAQIFGCRPNICGSETDSETVRVRR